MRSLISRFRDEHSDQIQSARIAADALLKACRIVQRSWSGSFAGWHGRMYFRDFKQPSIHEHFSGEWGGIHGIPSGWEERQTEQVTAKIEELVGEGFSAEQFEDTLRHLRKDAVALRDDLAIRLDSRDFANCSARQKELAERVEKYSFGKTMVDFVNAGLPGTLMSRDSEAIRQGTCVPVWLYYEGVALEGQTLCDATNEFLDLTERLGAIMETMSTRGRTADDSDPLRTLHRDIYDKCHELYEKSAYSEAVERGFKVVRDRLRRLTGYETGSEAFGKGKLYIKGAAAANVDNDFNEAVKFLAMAVDRFRNEKSHTSDARIEDPIRAYEYLRLSSLAMNLLENTEIRP